jgi:predicted N-acetyltransferase YhbS
LFELTECAVSELQIIPLAQIASADVEALLDQAFGTDRHQRTAYLLRKGMPEIAPLSFAAMMGEQLVGSLQSWPVALDTGEEIEPIILVGPVAVRPALQRGGVGKALMQRLIAEAPKVGVDAMVMIGDPEYYDRFFGFSNAATAGWNLPGPFEQHRLLARITRPGGVPSTGMIGPDPAFAQKAIAA